jgi:hypothetical protein
MGITKIRGPQRLLPPFKGEHLEQAAVDKLVACISSKDKPRFHMVGNIRFRDNPHYDWVNHKW